jgi:predicted MPP superfamily phosphohydrolase
MQLRAPLPLADRVNALDADLIVITGDIFDFDPRYIEEGCRELAALRARLGVYAVLGNHDVYTGADAVALGLERFTQIRLLRDAWTAIEAEGSAFALAGVEDPGRGWNERESTHDALERLAAEIPTDLPRVLLIHRPSWFPQAARLGFPLALAGHTHGGQIAYNRPYTTSRLISRWTRGLFGDADTVPSCKSGLGVAGPPRANCRARSPCSVCWLRAARGKNPWTPVADRPHTCFWGRYESRRSEVNASEDDPGGECCSLARGRTGARGGAQLRLHLGQRPGQLRHRRGAAQRRRDGRRRRTGAIQLLEHGSGRVLDHDVFDDGSLLALRS